MTTMDKLGVPTTPTRLATPMAMATGTLHAKSTSIAVNIMEPMIFPLEMCSAQGFE
jgi:hypothetical protein